MHAFLTVRCYLGKPMMQRERFDLLIIGAGINGAGLARDASGRGLRVALVDSGDLGSGTSAASTKLIHGGLRYLEFYEFDLVRKALEERETILSIAPHLAKPLSFVLPISRDTRPGWKIRAGLFLYDHLAKRPSFPNSERVRLSRDIAGYALDQRFKAGFRYWDGWVDDSRLVIANVQDAARRGAEVVPRDGVKAAFHSEEGWLAVLESGRELYAGRIVNCTGPWAEDVARSVLQLSDPPRLNLVQGSHIVVPRIGRHDDAYILQQPDGRIIFVIPFRERFSLIGTTETPVASAGAAQITDEETAYLIEAANRYLAKPIGKDDIVGAFAGVRPLVLEEGKDARETSREWKLHFHKAAPALTVIGGKLTTYRLLAEAVMKELYPDTTPWTHGEPLPGGDIPRYDGLSAHEEFTAYLRALEQRFPNHDPRIVRRLAGLYGTRAEAMLEEGLGERLGGIFETELAYLADEEWAATAEDVLWRRTKLGLTADTNDVAEIDRWFEKSYTYS